MSSTSPTNSRMRHARQPSRLSVVSSALSSASEEDEPAASRGAAGKRRIQDDEDDDENGDGEGDIGADEDAEGEEDDEEEEEEEEVQDEDDDEEDEEVIVKRPSRPPPRTETTEAINNTPTKPRQSLKITLKSRSPAQKKNTKAGRTTSSTSKAPNVASASINRPTRTVVKNNRGKKLIDSDSEDDDDLLDAEGEDDALGEEEEDELQEEDEEAADETLAAGGEEEEEEEEEVDREDTFLANMPKTARQLAKAGMGEELLELPLNDSSRKLKRTEAEVALMRSEVARRRRYQSEKKLDDEKTETINRLLKKQVGRKSTREMGRPDEEEDDDDEGEKEREVKRAKVLSRQEAKDLPKGMFRLVTRVDGTTVSVPGTDAGGGDLYLRKWNDVFGTGKIQVLDETRSGSLDQQQVLPPSQSIAT